MVFRYAAGLPNVEGLADGSGAEVLAVSCESDNGPLEHIVVYKEGVRTIPTPLPCHRHTIDVAACAGALAFLGGIKQ